MVISNFQVLQVRSNSILFTFSDKGALTSARNS